MSYIDAVLLYLKSTTRPSFVDVSAPFSYNLLSARRLPHGPQSNPSGEPMTALESFPRITPFLWFDNNAEEAVDFYLSVFKNSRKLEVVNNHPDHPNPPAKILTLSFELEGQKFTALNGGPAFAFTEAISFVVRCDTQLEVDDYWAKLTEGGKEIQCGWLKDKFGLTWQIVPGRLPELIKNPKALQAMMQMKKINIAELERAAQS
jgi:predicted 3-demethylubiquinone-9 3-methyltransferase (glyoxalase superfamily)